MTSSSSKPRAPYEAKQNKKFWTNTALKFIQESSTTEQLGYFEVVGRAGFELATFRLSVERSSRAELPAHRVEHRT